MPPRSQHPMDEVRRQPAEHDQRQDNQHQQHHAQPREKQPAPLSLPFRLRQ